MAKTLKIRDLTLRDLGNWAYARYNNVYGWISLNYSSLLQNDVYQNTQITVQPTCDSDGLQVVSCSSCNANAYKSTVHALGYLSVLKSIFY